DPGCLSALDDDETDPPPPPPACRDGIDNDHDGKTDYPADPGCASPDDTSELDTVTMGAITAVWQLQDWDDAGGKPISASCPAGADRAVVYSLPDGKPPADAVRDLFDCASGTGTTAPLPAGKYTVWTEITNHAGDVRFAQSFSQQVTLVAGANPSLTFP